MKILLIHTCAAEAVVGLGDEGGVRADRQMPGREASERLVAEIRALMSEVGWSVEELGAVAVVTGPGSFTGVRVGLAAAKGLCEAVPIGMVGISRLKLLGEPNGAVPVLDAGRGEFFCGGAGVGEKLLDARGARRLIAAHLVVSSEAKVIEALGAEVRLVDEPGSAAILRLALERIEAGEWSDVALTDANYLRRTDVELLKSNL